MPPSLSRFLLRSVKSIARLLRNSNHYEVYGKSQSFRKCFRNTVSIVTDLTDIDRWYRQLRFAEAQMIRFDMRPARDHVVHVCVPSNHCPWHPLPTLVLSAKQQHSPTLERAGLLIRWWWRFSSAGMLLLLHSWGSRSPCGGPSCEPCAASAARSS